MKTNHDDIYIGRNRNKVQCKIFTYDAMKSAALALSKKKYGRKSFSLVAHMALYKMLRDEGFIDLRKLLTEHKRRRAISSCG